MKAEDLLKDRKTLGGLIYDALRTKIISLVLRPGEMISENELAAEFEVSRTPVRQALFMLAREELIQILPQRGARVSKLSIAKVNEAQFVRESLESSAFAAVAAAWNNADPHFRRAEKNIRQLIAEQRQSVDAMDYMAFTKLDEAYHNAIIALAANPTLLGIVNDMRAHLNRVRFLELQEAHHEYQAIEHHEGILDALMQNDVAGVVTRLRDHLKLLEQFRAGMFRKHPDIFV